MGKRKVRIRRSPTPPEKDTDAIVRDLMKEMRDMNRRIGRLEEHELEVGSVVKHLEYSLMVLDGLRLSFEFAVMESSRSEQVDALFRNAALALLSTCGTLADYRESLRKSLAASGSVPYRVTAAGGPSDTPDENRSAIDDVINYDDGLDGTGI